MRSLVRRRRAREPARRAARREQVAGLVAGAAACAALPPGRRADARRREARRADIGGHQLLARPGAAAARDGGAGARIRRPRRRPLRRRRRGGEGVRRAAGDSGARRRRARRTGAGGDRARELGCCAESACEQALWTVRRTGSAPLAPHALVHAVGAPQRAALRPRGQRARADRRGAATAAAADPSRPIPAVQARHQLARAELLLGDRAAAGTMASEIEAVPRRCPELGTLAVQARELRAQLGAPGHDLLCGGRADGRRAAAGARARHASVVSRDRRAAVHLAPHRQIPRDVDLPQARRQLTQRSGATSARARAAVRGGAPTWPRSRQRHPSSISA